MHGNTGIERDPKSLLRVSCTSKCSRRRTWRGKRSATRQRTGYRPHGTTPPSGVELMHRLGHASFLVQMDGVNILTDPVWSHRYIPSLFIVDRRCSPFQWIGPARFTQPPCPITSLPPIDIVVISQYTPSIAVQM